MKLPKQAPPVQRSAVNVQKQDGKVAPQNPCAVATNCQPCAGGTKLCQLGTSWIPCPC